MDIQVAIVPFLRCTWDILDVLWHLKDVINRAFQVIFNFDILLSLELFCPSLGDDKDDNGGPTKKLLRDNEFFLRN
jgi:hypothetical protein